MAQPTAQAFFLWKKVAEGRMIALHCKDAPSLSTRSRIVILSEAKDPTATAV